jgi:hypothetical protein
MRTKTVFFTEFPLIEASIKFGIYRITPCLAYAQDQPVIAGGLPH